MINEQYKYSDLTSKVIGCAMRVHSTLGNGFQEVIYQRELAMEFTMAGISFSREFVFSTRLNVYIEKTSVFSK